MCLATFSSVLWAGASGPTSPATIEAAFGRLETDAIAYKPLDTVIVRITGRGKGDARANVRVSDPEQRQHFQTDVELQDNRGEVRFTASGALGAHYIYLTFPGEKRHSRYLNFRLDAETSIESGDHDIDQ